MTELRRMALWALCALLLAGGIAACGRGGDEGAERPLKIGYVVNYMSHEWYQNICNAAERRARELGVDLIIADANLDVAAQISKAENLMAQGVDVLILTPVDAKALGPVVQQARASGIHVITESSPVAGSDAYVGIDDKASGKKAAMWFATYARERDLDPKILIIGVPNFETCRLRVEGFVEGLQESGIAYEIKQEVDGQGLKERALKVAQDALTAHPDINVIYGINDDSTTGGMSAYRAAGLDEGQLTAIGFGFEGVVGRTALLGDTPYKAALAMFPDFVGVSLVEAAVKLSQGERMPVHFETPTVMITRENFDRFYQRQGEGAGESYAMNFDAIRELMP
jgi:ABC-type sugar transport system substrate-binding protein